MTLTDLNKKRAVGCIGCAIASKTYEPPGGLILETDNFVLHQDPVIPIKGFLIVASKKHIQSITQLNSEEARELFDLVYRARTAMSLISDIEEVTIIQEERSSHLHVWLFPRYEWMNTRFDRSLTSVREITKVAGKELQTVDNNKEVLTTVELIKKLIQ
jgi:diadenosine tetraphosphate (Ap4A) HIT family hydrolase